MGRCGVGDVVWNMESYESEVVIAMQVGDENCFDAVALDVVAKELCLCAFATVYEIGVLVYIEDLCGGVAV